MNIRLFGKNTAIYAIGNLGLRAAGFLLIPIYTHSLSVADYGQLMILLITIQVMLTLMSFGTWSSVVRFLSELDAKNMGVRLPCNSLLINLLGGIVISVISLVFLKPFFLRVLKTQEVYIYITLACSVAIAQSACMHGMSYYRARNEARKFALAGLSASALLIGLVFLFLSAFGLGVKGVLVAQTVSYGIASVLIIKNVLSNADFTISVAVMKRLLRFGFPIVFSGLACFAMNSSSKYFISHFSGLDVVAIYSLGDLLASVLAVAIALPFQLAYEPYVFSNLDTLVIPETMARLFTYALLSLVLAAFALISICRPLLPIIAPSDYASAYLVMLWLLPKFVFEGVYHVGNTLLRIERKTHIAAAIVMVGAVLNLILNYALVPRFGWWGGALATNISFILTAVVVLVVGIRKFWIPTEWSRIAIIIGFLIYSLLIAFLLYGVSNGVVYIVNGATLLASVFILRYSSILDEYEKSAIAGMKKRIMYRTCLR